MKVAAALQASFDDVRRRDLKLIDDVARRRRERCSSCDFWREQYDRAQRDADRYAAQLTGRGDRPAPRLDGHHADFTAPWPNEQESA